MRTFATSASSNKVRTMTEIRQVHKQSIPAEEKLPVLFSSLARAATVPILITMSGQNSYIFFANEREFLTGLKAALAPVERRACE
jgi:hypothetical protein